MQFYLMQCLHSRESATEYRTPIQRSDSALSPFALQLFSMVVSWITSRLVFCLSLNIPAIHKYRKIVIRNIDLRPWSNMILKQIKSNNTPEVLSSFKIWTWMSVFPFFFCKLFLKTLPEVASRLAQSGGKRLPFLQCFARSTKKKRFIVSLCVSTSFEFNFFAWIPDGGIVLRSSASAINRNPTQLHSSLKAYTIRTTRRTFEPKWCTGPLSFADIKYHFTHDPKERSAINWWNEPTFRLVICYQVGLAHGNNTPLLLSRCSVSWTSSGSLPATVGWLIARSVTRLADDIDVPILSSTETPWIESKWSSSQLIWQSCVASTSLSRLLKTFNLGLLALNLCLLASQKCLELQDLVWYLVAQLMLAFAWFRCVTRESIAVLADVWVLWNSCLPIT